MGWNKKISDKLSWKRGCQESWQCEWQVTLQLLILVSWWEFKALITQKYLCRIGLHSKQGQPLFGRSCLEECVVEKALKDNRPKFKCSHPYPLSWCHPFSIIYLKMWCVWVLSVQLFATPWTITHQAPLSMEFSRQVYWSRLPFPSPCDRPDPGIEPASPALADGFFTTVSAKTKSHHPGAYAKISKEKKEEKNVKTNTNWETHTRKIANNSPWNEIQDSVISQGRKVFKEEIQRLKEYKINSK